MKTKHTQGKWKYDARSGCVAVYEQERGDVKCFAGKEPSFIHFRMYTDEYDDETKLANARLIAAAPEMLDAIMRVIKLQKTLYGNATDTHVELSCMINDLISVIENANGQTIDELMEAGE